jgi:ATP-dependent protease ClpP protease subunit
MPHEVQPLDAHIKLFGTVDDDFFHSFAEQLQGARKAQGGSKAPLLVSLTTTGGDAETARRIAHDIRLCRDEGVPMRVVGIASVYSAGITILAAFPPSDRYLTRGTELLIHERRLDTTVELKGPLRACMDVLNDKMAELQSGHRLECAGFELLVAGTSLTADDVLEKVTEADWYLDADEAARLGLVRAVV